MQSIYFYVQSSFFSKVFFIFKNVFICKDVYILQLSSLMRLSLSLKSYLLLSSSSFWDLPVFLCYSDTRDLFAFKPWCCCTNLFLGSMLPQYMTLCVCVSKRLDATSNQGRRLRFGLLTLLTNIRSTKVLGASHTLAWLSSATLKNFISGVSTRILIL